MGGGGPMTSCPELATDGGREISGEFTDDCEPELHWEEPVPRRLELGLNSGPTTISPLLLFRPADTGAYRTFSLGSSIPKLLRKVKY